MNYIAVMYDIFAIYTEIIIFCSLFDFLNVIATLKLFKF